MNDPVAWYQNLTIWCGFAAWITAQSLKMMQDIYVTRRLDFAVLVSTGGMPSAHSAAVCAAATSIGLEAGFGSPLFGLAFGFAGIVMFDAQSVRQSAGHQARILNQIVESLFKEHHFSQGKLVELLGHTRLEVFAGLATGILVALIIYSLV